MSSKLAAIQMASGPNVGANLTEAGRLLNLASKMGAGLTVLPENFASMPMKDEDRTAIAETFGSGQIQDFLSSKAREHKIWIVGGTVPILSESSDKSRSASLLFDDKGECVARYDKIHLFDVMLENGEQYNESSFIEAGEEVVVVDTPFGKLGMSICYDLRFPELYRKMLDQKAEIFSVPSAFTDITGKAHWEPLVRARAIENLCYVVAAGQGGYHISGRETHGDSMIVSPWGKVLDRLPRGSGVIAAEFEKDRLIRARKSLPSISHRRL
ncbi:MAG: carbon-nitrogen hydrolase family protein [Proteobacteria bacterium]|nr:carbon-nitrogen hydrolase family protein [Pseudomonadota bacterium]